MVFGHNVGGGPSDYAILKIHTLPSTGGDTVCSPPTWSNTFVTNSRWLWASGYEIYESLSPLMAVFLEGPISTSDASFFHDEARRLANTLRDG